MRLRFKEMYEKFFWNTENARLINFIVTVMIPFIVFDVIVILLVIWLNRLF